MKAGEWALRGNPLPFHWLESPILRHLNSTLGMPFVLHFLIPTLKSPLRSLHPALAGMLARGVFGALVLVVFGGAMLCTVLESQAQVGGQLLPETLPWPEYLEDKPNYSEDPIPYIEEFLAPMAEHMLNHDSILYKIELNKHFRQALAEVLQRQDSYDYEFTMLKTISRVRPEDNSFRIFTWYLQDTLGNHQYYGLLQRRRETGLGTEVQVIALFDRVDYSPQVESTPLDPNNWFGALYYKPRYSDYGVLTYEGQWARVDGFTGKRYKEDIKYYVLLGWNGHTQGNNYKIIDIITFTGENNEEIRFGAPVFYMTTIPKSRRVFKYSDNSPFSLNQALVMEKGPLGMRKVKKKMIVFDHLEKPNKARQSTFWNLGMDGTVDAFVFINRVSHQRKGIFGFLRDVSVYEPGIENYDPKVVKQQREEAMERLRSAGIELQKKKKRGRDSSESDE